MFLKDDELGVYFFNFVSMIIYLFIVELNDDKRPNARIHR